MVVSQIGVRTADDSKYEAHEKKLMEDIARQNKNPFECSADFLFGAISVMYRDYLYASGTMLLMWTWWGAYPTYSRLRHKNIMRFRRRRQWEFRRWFFYTRHIPKWDKKYLQAVELPSPYVGPGPVFTPVSPSMIVPSHGSHRSEALMTPLTGTRAEDDNFLVKVNHTAAASFAGGGLSKMETGIAAGVAAINGSLQQSLQTRRILSRNDVDVGKLHEEVAQLIKASRGVVVLKETHNTRHSVPLGREIWWVSLEEARRRWEWWFWASILVAARVLQDLLDMPEMPDFVQ
ncbi:uncharacterized protein TEOVI_000823800 [Trypanosoma equiperdum]|uniref:Uncharacterized protein n=1 Tax=Trypanosoma equiperdum TaxID=5694 RepID=A0A1G4I435_TRYEQ|nr:hypothetical protein, conserved [Trypanosoma equiperdum]